MGILPPEVEELINVALVSELTVLDSRGRPTTYPLIPLYDGKKIYMHSSVLFSKKLEHINRNPRVSLTITDPIAAQVEPFRRATIQGDAVVLDQDLHSGWEKTVLPMWIEKEPVVAKLIKQRFAMPLFWERAVIEITPRRVFVWPKGETVGDPDIFELEAAA